MQRDSLGCKVCIQGMDVVYGLLDSGATRDVIEQALGKVCELMPEPSAQQHCRTFITQEYDHLFEWLESSYSSEVLCTLMTACEYPLPPMNSVCEVCMVGFTFLEDLLKFKPTQHLIEEGLNYICYIFPEGDLRAECQGFIDKEFERLVDWVGKEFPPSFICTAVDACDFPFDPIEDGLCIFCEGAFTFLYDMINFDNNHGEGFIQLLLDYICELFPVGDSKDACLDFIEAEYQKLVDFIEHEFPPENICILVGACESNITPVYETECEFCVIFYQLALDLLNFDVTVEAVEHLLQYICDVFPPLLKITCDVFIKKFYERLLEMLSQKYNTYDACEMMGACSL